MKGMAEPVVTLKSRVEKEVVDQLIASLNNGSLKVEDAQQVARDTLEAVEQIENHEKSVVDFYEVLATKHKAFEILYTRIKGDISRAHEEAAYKQALSAINAGDVNSAKNIASEAINSTANETDIN